MSLAASHNSFDSAAASGHRWYAVAALVCLLVGGLLGAAWCRSTIGYLWIVGEYRGEGANVVQGALPRDDGSDWPCWQTIQPAPVTHKLVAFPDDPGRMRIELDPASPKNPAVFEIVRDIRTPPAGRQAELSFEVRGERLDDLAEFRAEIENVAQLNQFLLQRKFEVSPDWQTVRAAFPGTDQDSLLRIEFGVRGRATVEIRNVNCRLLPAETMAPGQ